MQRATEQEALADEQTALAESFDSLPSQLGEVLQKKMEEGIKTKKELARDFFEKMDINHDVGRRAVQPASMACLPAHTSRFASLHQHH